ncbi:MAG TPA: ABC transporter permease [Jatrophihabitans sp.]|uniref:ABC transporter permease n=1 Tax=Jatrophihabitans sp. TaxID=1932789 RepID=UPI002DF7E576|nr:ABC transporter permease [Jatrophihabitans sp.]
MHDRLAVLEPERPHSYDPRRTLRLRVEFTRQLRRRRTQITFGLLLILPIIIAIAFKVGGSADSQAPQLVGLATAGGFNFALFTEFAAVGFLLIVVVALFFGDTVASEASWSSLRYLLAQPVPRSRLLKQKLIVSASLAVAANVLLPLWAFIVGGLFFGWSPAQSPIGGSFSVGESVLRIAVIVGYICIVLMIVASLAFLLSLTVDNPLGAVGGAVMLAVVSTILDQITALGSYRNYLPTHFQYAWIDSLSTPIRYDDMLRGAGLACVYTAIFLGWAWLRFDRKDITS